MTGPVKAEGMFLAPISGSALFQAFCRTFFLCYCPLRVEGRDQLPDPPFIICSNHTSHIDSAVLMTASGLPFSTFAMLGARDYFFEASRVRFVVSRFMNVIPIDRHAQHNSLRQSLAMCGEFLQRRRGNLIFYPEGTRSSNGEIQAFKKGAGMFAVELGVPVVPAYIVGARGILAKGKLVPRPGTVTVRFGEPIRFASNSSDPVASRGIRKAAVDLLEQRIRGLSRNPLAVGLAGSLEEERPTTISISPAARPGQNTKAAG
ncbi:MAG: lysophospholipid acyltransferase family protein [Candidatus Sulfotelmatobacter sp.]